MSEASYIVALGYIEGEVLILYNFAFFSVQWTADLDFLIANVHWLCHFDVQVKFSSFTFKLYIRYSINLFSNFRIVDFNWILLRSGVRNIV
jgi:hypothetical protein